MRFAATLVLLLSAPALAQVPNPPGSFAIDGVRVAEGSTNRGVQQGPTSMEVCTVAMIGSHATYDVGPGKTYSELDSVPFGSLVAGDVVNIYARPTPYKTKIGLRAQGTSSKPVIINGVTGIDCKRPVLDFAGSRTASGSASVFSSTPQYGESLAGVIIKRGANDAYGVYQPKFIIVQGLHMQGARNGATYTTLTGGTATFDSAACIWVQNGEDITIRNSVMTDCGFGVFMMAKDGMLSETTLRITIANSRIYGNGVPGSYLEHGFYVQAANPIIEGNFIGGNRSGSEGSSYKSRASGEIFRRNYVICSARCIDFVHTEEQTNGIAKRPDYGTDYVYSNTIVSSGPEAIHYGGDNMGEQESGAAIFVPPLPYRRHLRFWNNTYSLTTSSYRAQIFDLSEKATEVDAWGNTFNLNFTGNRLSWVGQAGQLRLGPGNVINGTQPADAEEGAASDGRFSVTTVGTLPSDPLLSTLN